MKRSVKRGVAYAPLSSEPTVGAGRNEDPSVEVFRLEYDANVYAGRGVRGPRRQVFGIDGFHDDPHRDALHGSQTLDLCGKAAMHDGQAEPVADGLQATVRSEAHCGPATDVDVLRVLEQWG